MSMYDDYDDGDYPADYDDEPIDGVGFARPGSALRAETEDNPRIHRCPSCGARDVLTEIDVMRGYQCDACANAAERGIDPPDYWDDE
jgi:hypothetical protein